MKKIGLLLSFCMLVLTFNSGFIYSDIEDYEIVSFNDHSNINWGNSIFRTGDTTINVKNMYNYSRNYDGYYAVRVSARDLLKLNKIDPNRIVYDTGFRTIPNGQWNTRVYENENVVKSFRDDILTSLQWKDNGAYSDENWMSWLRVSNEIDYEVYVREMTVGFGFELTKPLNVDVAAFSVGVSRYEGASNFTGGVFNSVNLVLTDFTDNEHIFDLEFGGALGKEYLIGHLPYTVRGIKAVGFEFDTNTTPVGATIPVGGNITLGMSISNFNLFSEYDYRPGLPTFGDEDIFEYESCGWTDIGCNVRNALKFMPNLIYNIWFRGIANTLLEFINNAYLFLTDVFSVIEFLPAEIRLILLNGLLVLITYKMIKVVS